MSVNHYENFPVASILLPKKLRKAVTDIYRFARCADDLADEGDGAVCADDFQLAVALEQFGDDAHVVGLGMVDDEVVHLFKGHNLVDVV